MTDVTGEFYEETMTVFVTDNSAPQITNVEADVPDYTENDGPVAITSTITLSDADDINLQSAEVRTPIIPAQDVLSFSDYGPFTSSWDEPSGRLTITGSASIADWQSALRTVTYENLSEDPTPGQLWIYFDVSDGNETSNIGTRSLNVVAVNDAPSLNSSSLGSVYEDDSDPAGETISDIFSAQFSDVDGTFGGVAVTNDSTTTEGVWEFSVDGGSTWVAVGSVSESSALRLMAADRLRFVPATGFYGPVPTLGVVGFDDTYGSHVWLGSGSTITGDVSTRGGSTPFSVNVANLDSTVMAVGPTDLSNGISLNTNGGNDAYLFADNGAALLDGLSALTIETQLSMDEMAPDGFVPIISYATPTQFNALLLAVDADGTVFVHVNDTRIDGPEDVLVPVDGRPHALAFSWDATHGEVAIYLDGDLIHYQSGVKVGETIGASGALVFGQDQDAVDGGYDTRQVFKGTMHDVRIWNEARSEAELAQSHRQKFHTDALPASLIANWQMDGVDVSGDVVDIVSGAKLAESRVADPGFTSGNIEAQLIVAEHTPNGTYVGTVRPHSSTLVDDLVTDGSFKLAGSTGFDMFYAGQPIGTGSPWMVDSGDVNLNGGWGDSPLGGTVLDLNGFNQGAISQTMSTEIGETYQVSFALTGNFDDPADKSLSGTAAGTTETFTVKEPGGWINTTSLMWERRGFEFTATAASTTLTFSSLMPSGQYGPVISDVQVVKRPAGVTELLAADPALIYDAGTGKFYKPGSSPQAFFDARDAAISETLNGVAGQLVTIESDNENNVVLGIARSMGTDVWLGATDTTTEGQWYWLKGDQDDRQFWSGTDTGLRVNNAYNNWNIGEPNEGNAGEDGAKLYQLNGRWNDDDENDLNGFVVEWDADEVLSAFRYSLTSDPSGAFAIDESTGDITVADGSLLDYELSTSHDIVVTVTDVTGEAHDETVTVQL
ncbi:MAG: LamG-like jellyroll fold domain-containing protein, partial [Pseudomonadota bacterium]